MGLRHCRRTRAAAPGIYSEVLFSAAYTIGRSEPKSSTTTPARADLIAAGETLIGSAHRPPNAREVYRVVIAGDLRRELVP
jgi:hypothetical protein